MAQLRLSRILMDERKIVTNDRELEGKTYIQTEDGGILKEVRVPVCDVCGRQNDQYNSCTGCRRKLCRDCSIRYMNRIFCLDCLQELLPLTKKEYKVLLAVQYGLDKNKIEEAMRAKAEEVNKCFKSLREKCYIETKGFLFFHEAKILEKGIEALETYRQVYDKEEDVLIFQEDLRRVMSAEI